MMTKTTPQKVNPQITRESFNGGGATSGATSFILVPQYLHTVARALMSSIVQTPSPAIVDSEPFGLRYGIEGPVGHSPVEVQVLSPTPATPDRTTRLGLC
jgi:hypothetical protein